MLTVPNVLKEFAQLLGTEVKNHRLEIPEKFGRGYCAGFVFNENIRMLIFNYELNEDLIISNPYDDKPDSRLLFKFQNIFPITKDLPMEKDLQLMPSVLIATMHMSMAEIPVHTNTATINIEVDAHYLNGLFDLTEKSLVLQSLLQNNQPLLFEQIIYPSLHQIAAQMVSEPIEEIFQLFFLRVKAEELICRLLMELARRNEKHIYDLNPQDIQILYKVKVQC
ncbi:hypothetical protein [Dyadobacter sp. CY356]|uniref:hypothetical protein n=1 Tax=Dyadobacter sp. CY356 TaxID=2906442 RepID=UPI001F491678|nr:hypothetical protein [Dyadobacter sp. CY356]MCF0058806.1 hypothetical protein [Dyadobacter sp. CY356]